MNSKTYETLRVICCILSALILAAAVFIFIYLGFVWGFVSLAVAGLFAALTFFFKRKQEELENSNFPEKGDFITGPVGKDNDADD